MIRLQIEDFSTIRSADFVLATTNVLIGPQASGKSVISKLLYFFLEILTDQYESITKGRSFENFTDEIKEEFSDWFPISAWGNSKFKISVEIGEYKMSLTRTSYSKSVKNNLRLWTSGLAKTHYTESQTFYGELTKKASAPRKTASGAFLDPFEEEWRMTRASINKLAAALGDDYIISQIFIPAGRSFFTNLGRAFMAFDQGRILDPITIKFGRLYSSYHDTYRHFQGRTRGGRSLEADLAAILGGEVVWEDERALVQCADGRRIPFSALSSGQQELFPLVTVLQSIGRLSLRRTGKEEIDSQLLYIEEPEAHLFPSAQSTLVQGLVSLVNEAPRQRLLLTTHSPYVLSKINNLVKAGHLEKSVSDAKQASLNRIVAKRFRIAPGSATAYAIMDGELRSIIDNDGLIAADYLDDVSGQISDEFSRLLQLEATE